MKTFRRCPFLVAISAAVFAQLPSSDAGLTPVNGHLIRVANSFSSNWSGYATTTGGPFTSASATWTEPAVSCPKKGSSYSSFWVGIDGDGSNTVEQTGSESDCRNGRPTYYAWYEMYPAYPVDFSSPVYPGDFFSASVTYSPSGYFTLSLSDITENWTQTEQLTSSTPQRYSAEVIAEAPSSGGKVLPLADFGTATFGSATVDGAPIDAFSPDPITMISSGGVVKAAPSTLDTAGDFTDTWAHS